MNSIEQITLHTADTHTMYTFYIQLLGEELVTKQDEAFTITLGTSQIQFIPAAEGSVPFYHFAINIAANHFTDAKRWLSGFGELLTEQGKDEAYFDFFDAYACYIEDPAGNILELISRQQAAPVIEAPFSPQQLLSVGEINVTTSNVGQAARLLHDAHIPVQLAEIEDSQLNFVGAAADVYLLLGPAGRRWLFSERVAELHPLSIQMSNGAKLSIDQKGELVTELPA